MGKKVILQRKRLAAIFASFAILIIGTASLLESMSLDYYSVLNTLQKIIPASLALGGLGWFMGMILDKQKKHRGRGGHNNLFINELMKNTASETHTLANENAENIENTNPS